MKELEDELQELIDRMDELDYDEKLIQKDYEIQIALVLNRKAKVQKAINLKLIQMTRAVN